MEAGSTNFTYGILAAKEPSLIAKRIGKAFIFKSACVAATCVIGCAPLTAAPKTNAAQQVSRDRSTLGTAPVLLHPGEDIQAKIDENPAATIFRLAGGTYRLQQLKPKNDDSFVGAGQEETILNGAILVDRFEPLGTAFAAKYKANKGQIHGECDALSPMCKYPEDCFFDNKPLRRIEHLAQLESGTWLLDDVGDMIILADDPKGHSVEVSAARTAFAGPASGVSISALTVEKYAIPAQMGAIGDQYPGKRWSISRCTIRLNHGAGVVVSDDSVVAYNKILSNGQLGLGGHGQNVLITNNEIAANNFAGFSQGWEAGGAKFSRTTHLRVQNNKVHDNVGAGLWTDSENRDALYENNDVFNNKGSGIQHEIGFDARILRNAVWGNGSGARIWLWGGQISIQNSSNTEVTGNRVVVPETYGNGIVILMQNRGKYVSINNQVHDNDITYRGKLGASGIACDFSQNLPLVRENHFDRNHYHVKNKDGLHWFWLTEEGWQGFRQMGNERQGTLDEKLTFAQGNE